MDYPSLHRMMTQVMRARSSARRVARSRLAQASITATGGDGATVSEGGPGVNELDGRARILKWPAACTPEVERGSELVVEILTR